MLADKIERLERDIRFCKNVVVRKLLMSIKVSFSNTMKNIKKC
jgi:hypothetical protein